MTQLLDLAKLDSDYWRSLSAEREGELLLDRVAEMVRGVGGDELAIAAGVSRGGMIQVAIGTRDSNGCIDFDLWKFPTVSWDPNRFAVGLQSGELS
jgi:hypothetical protein